jgi:hypothetical protein
MTQLARFAIRSASLLAFVSALICFTPSGAQARCWVVADKPKLVTTRDGQRVIVGQARRGGTCPSRALVHVQLRHDRNLWPDTLLARADFTVRSGALRVSYVCKGSGTKTVFVEAWAPGESDQSARIKVDACQ